MRSPSRALSLSVYRFIGVGGRWTLGMAKPLVEVSERKYYDYSQNYDYSQKSRQESGCTTNSYVIRALYFLQVSCIERFLSAHELENMHVYMRSLIIVSAAERSVPFGYQPRIVIIKVNGKRLKI